MAKWLVAFDTDKIKQYVFRTSTLKEIRGASALLDRLNRSEMPGLVGGDCIYANGGGGLFVIDADNPQAAIQSVERLYTTSTHSGSITGAAVPMPAKDSEVKDALALLRHQLRAAKATSVEPDVPVTHPLFRFCDVCGAEYAESQQGDEQVCRSCAAKRDENRSVQAGIARWIAGSGCAPGEEELLWYRLIRDLRAGEYPLAGHDRPETFEDLGETSKPRGYMGLIYADGDNMGRIIEDIGSTEEMGRFSDAVDGALHTAVADAIREHLEPGESGPLPFDVLLLGGDDLVMVTSAHKALEVAAHIVQKFSKLTEDNWGRPLSLSVSVTLTHTSYPIGPLIQLAESGLKFAKRTAAERRLDDPDYAEGLINFLVVDSPNHVEFSRYYRETLRTKEGTSVILRTMRPYTVEQVQGLLAKVRSARKMPRAKLEQLRSAVFKTRRQGTLDAMKAVLRTRGKERRKMLFELVGETEEVQVNLPWIKLPQGGWTTPVLDVVELLDFVEGSPDEARAADDRRSDAEDDDQS